jgi:hypothetical protein
VHTTNPRTIRRLVGYSALPIFTALVLLAGCDGDSHGARGRLSCQTPADAEPVFKETYLKTQENTFDMRTSGVTRRRFVNVNIDLFKRIFRNGKPRSLRLALFPDKEIEMQVLDVEILSAENIVVTGNISGSEQSAITLVINDGVMVANILDETTDENFEVRYTGDGVHSIQQLGPATEGDCLAFEPPDSFRESTQGSEFSVLAPPVIDILAVYTPNARIHQGGTNAIRALIQMGIADTNRAYADSGVALSVRLVGMMETRQNETSSYFSDLDALSGTVDGHWDEIHAVRRRLGADQVSLVGAYLDNNKTQGIGYINATADSAFTIVKDTVFGKYTFSHELGHNIGLNHSDGYENNWGRFRTIMAYGTQKRIRRFSNPNLRYNGFLTGTAAKYSAKILNANAFRIANLLPAIVRQPSVPGPLPISDTDPGTCD